jgi:hypothetical protein
MPRVYETNAKRRQTVLDAGLDTHRTWAWTRHGTGGNSKEQPKKLRVYRSAVIRAGVMSCYQYDKGLEICIESE